VRGGWGLGGERELDRAYLRAIILPRPPPVPYALRVPNGQASGGIRTSREGSAPSSSGLGHRPFKAAARVRIPLGLPLETVGTAGQGSRGHARIAGLTSKKSKKQGPVEQLGVLVTLSR
jgi:hypothetical protein